jgi:D-aminopeptidase
MAIDFVQSEMADKAALLPGARRMERRVEYSAADMVTIYAAFRTALALARG